MKDKKKLIIIISCITLGLLALILVLTSCNKESDLQEKEALQLNSIKQLNAQTIPDGVIYEIERSSGYVCADDIVFTRNIDKKKALEALKPYMIFYDGKPVHTDSNIVVNINGDRADVSVTFPNGKVGHVNTGIQVIDAPDGVEFAAVSPYYFFRYACVIDKSTCPSGYDVNKTPLNANKAFYTNLINPEFDLNYNDSLQEENDIWSESTIRTGNGKYHHAFANVRILEGLTVSGFTGTSNNHDTYQSNENTNDQMEQQFPEDQAPDITNPDNPNYNNNPEPNNGNQEVVNNGDVNNGNETPTVEDDVKSFGESIKQGFDDFKTNVENNPTFKTVTIVVSSIIGILLIYVVFLIIRKIWRVIRS